MTFSSLGLIDPLVRKLDELGYAKPNPCRRKRFLPCWPAVT